MSITVKPGYVFGGGTGFVNGGLNFIIELREKNGEPCVLHLYKKIKKEPDLSIEFPKDGVYGNLHTLWVSGLPETYIAYRLTAGMKELADRRATALVCCSGFGKKRIQDRTYYRLPSTSQFDWEEDELPRLDGSAVIAYKLHVRGFTAALKTKNAGSFGAIIDKIAYFKDLGVNQIELMPAYDFDETEYMDTYEGNRPGQSLPLKSRRLINYWGYKKAHYFAPKAVYAGEKGGILELKTLVRELHKNKMELIMEFYFPREVPISEISDVLKYYITEYHIDGVHVISDSQLYPYLKQEPVLADKKLYLEYTKGREENVYHYNDGFLTDARRYIKGDDLSLQTVLSYFMPDSYNRINYFAGHNGFSLADCFAYDRKHNEKNGFDNMDGTDYNFSWNCGKEGISKSGKILALRLKQMKNAVFITMMSRGIPLIHSGDEMGKTQKGNNNSFCQDNSLSYIDWDDLNKNKEFLEFFKDCVRFRKAHPILSCEESKLINKSQTGWPLLSFHSDKAWDFKIRSYDKAVGLLYNGEYYRNLKEESDSLLYIGMNMHYERVSLALPRLSKAYEWKPVLDSSGECKLTENAVEMAARSSVALVAEKITKINRSKRLEKKR